LLGRGYTGTHIGVIPIPLILQHIWEKIIEIAVSFFLSNYFTLIPCNHQHLNQELVDIFRIKFITGATLKTQSCVNLSGSFHGFSWISRHIRLKRKAQRWSCLSENQPILWSTLTFLILEISQKSTR
jgi:hypothetical protein